MGPTNDGQRTVSEIFSLLERLDGLPKAVSDVANTLLTEYDFPVEARQMLRRLKTTAEHYEKLRLTASESARRLLNETN